jgi:hypothetical protein
LAVGVVGETNRAGLGNAFNTRGDIDAVAHQFAVGLLDNIAKMDADAALGRHACIAFDHSVLQFDRAARRVDYAAKFNEEPIAGPFDHAPFVNGNSGVDQIAA